MTSWGTQIDAWISAGIFLILTAAVIVGAVIFSHLIGPRRRGTTKDTAYESGMATIGESRRRINPHFYLIALLFLLFDVELVFFYPWAKLMGDTEIQSPDRRIVLFFGIATFVFLLIVGYIYAWLKGVFRWR